EVIKALNDILTPYGVIVENVGTSDYRFNPEYQKAIEERKIAEQRVEVAKSKNRATVEEYLAKVEEAKGEVSQVKAKADGEYKQEVIKADALFKQMERQAEAIKAEGRAEAEGVRKMNEALSGPGGEAVVKLAIAKALAGKRIVQIPMGGGFDVRSTNINSLLELYGAKAAAQPPSPAPAKK
ncbi:MAG: SPFH domain-containing protein, partial [Candidatus Hydrogenedentes bacterium]|nr:SPFH domain-containing protein [Candidatus Hydrogenedentota bacterium]